MVDINLTISVVNICECSKYQNQKTNTVRVKEKKDSNTLCPPEILFKSKGSYMLKIKAQRKIYHVNMNQKKTGVNHINFS